MIEGPHDYVGFVRKANSCGGCEVNIVEVMDIEGFMLEEFS